MTPRPFFSLLSVALLTSAYSFAQAPSPDSPPAGAPAPIVRSHGSQGGPMRGGPQGGGPQRMNETPIGHEGGMGMGPHSRIAPPGMWWKRPETIQLLTLTPAQQTKMDDIFQKSRIQLIDLKATVEKQEVTLEPMLDANPPDTAKVLAQIDHLAQARAELEKANARMLLGIRGVLTADQWTKLQTAKHERGGRMNFDKGGRGGPGAGPMGGPGGMMGHHDGMAGGGPGFMIVDPENSHEMNFTAPDKGPLAN
jgi:Spy/CpxP family protein refolding chaperone